MGIFDKFKNKSNVKIENTELVVPITGELVELSSVPDPVFAEKMMGDGFAINPTNGKVLSPISGKIGSIFPTKHAIGIVADENTEVLIHFGLETVSLNGDGFVCHVVEGQEVKAGDLILEVDIKALNEKVISKEIPSLITPIIFTKLVDKSFDVKYGTHEAGSKDIITIK